VAGKRCMSRQQRRRRRGREEVACLEAEGHAVQAETPMPRPGKCTVAGPPVRQEGKNPVKKGDPVPGPEQAGNAEVGNAATAGISAAAFRSA